MKKHKRVKKNINFKKSNFMKKLDVMQMENLQGNGGRKCYLAGVMLVASGGLFATGVVMAGIAGGWGLVNYSDCF